MRSQTGDRARKIYSAREGNGTMTTVTSDRESLIRKALAANSSAYGQGIELRAPGHLSVTCDALSALAGHVSREYGDYGYRFELMWTITAAVTIAQVAHSDGSRFIVAADKWGSVRRLDNGTLDSLAAGIAAMHESAVAS